MRLSVAFSAKANPQHFWFLFSTSSGCLFVCLRFSMLLSVMCVCGLVLFIFLSLIHPSLLINWIGTEWPAILNGKLALPISQWIDKLITKVSYIYWITINTHTHTLFCKIAAHIRSAWWNAFQIYGKTFQSFFTHIRNFIPPNGHPNTSFPIWIALSNFNRTTQTELFIKSFMMTWIISEFIYFINSLRLSSKLIRRNRYELKVLSTGFSVLAWKSSGFKLLKQNERDRGCRETEAMGTVMEIEHEWKS